MIDYVSSNPKDVLMQYSLIYYIFHWIVSAVAILVTAKLVRGFKVSGFFSALVAALGIAISNYFLWPVLIFLTLPINILTLGLFTFVINGMILKISALFLPGFSLESWMAAIFGSIVLLISKGILHYIFV